MFLLSERVGGISLYNVLIGYGLAGGGVSDPSFYSTTLTYHFKLMMKMMITVMVLMFCFALAVLREAGVVLDVD